MPVPQAEASAIRERFSLRRLKQLLLLPPGAVLALIPGDVNPENLARWIPAEGTTSKLRGQDCEKFYNMSTSSFYIEHKLHAPDVIRMREASIESDQRNLIERGPRLRR